MPTDSALVSATGLCKTYAADRSTAATPALAGVDFAARRGTFIALMGPSGSGKSTLLQILGGLDVPDSGEVILDGVRYSSLDDDALTRLRNRDIGFVFQFFNLVPTLTARENVMFPALLGGVGREVARRRADDLLAACAVLEGAGRFPDALSGGQQQRVALARALINEPRLVLADEPTGSLDRATGREVLGILLRLTRERNATVIMATHDPEAAEYSDVIVKLRDGRIDS